MAFCTSWEFHNGKFSKLDPLVRAEVAVSITALSAFSCITDRHLYVRTCRVEVACKAQHSHPARR